MAGDVSFVLDADTARAVNAFLKVVDAQDKMAQASGKSARNLRDVDRALGKSSQSGQGLLATFQQFARFDPFSLATAGARALVDELTKANNKAKEFNKELSKSTSSAGDIRDYPKIKKELRNLPAPYATMDERRRVYDTLRQQLPDADRKTVMEYSKYAAQTTGYMADPVEFARMMGAASVSFKGKSADDLADISEYLRTGAGGKVGQVNEAGMTVINQGVEAGLSAEKSASFVMAAMKARQSPETMSMVYSRLQQKYDLAPLKRGQKPTAEEAEFRRFAETESPEERLQLLRGGSKDLQQRILGDQALKFRTIMQQDPESFERGMNEAQQTNMFQRNLAAGRVSFETELRQKRAQVRQDLAENDGGQATQGLDARWEEKKADWAERGGGSTWTGAGLEGISRQGPLSVAADIMEWMGFSQLRDAIEENTRVQRENNLNGNNPNAGDY